MSWLRLLKAESRKLATTKLPLGFLAVVGLVSAVVAVAVLMGAGTDDAEGLFDTIEAQTSLLSFGMNAMIIGGLFGAIVAAREYAHGTSVPMFLAGPHRYQALLAQLTVVVIFGGLLGLAGGGLTIAAGALTLPIVDYQLLLPVDVVVRLGATSGLAGAVGAVLGAGIGALIRNTGGAVTAAVAILLLGPPIVAQLVNDAAAWVPGSLISVISGLGENPGLGTAIAALAIWGLVPAVIGVFAVQKRDVI
jgi:hypothetical protein